MAKSVARVVEEQLAKYPVLEDYLVRGLVNQSALARELLPRVKKELETTASSDAVIMAVKRHASELKPRTKGLAADQVIAGFTLNLKSGVADISIEKPDNVFVILNELSKRVNTRKGELLSVIQGTSEIAIITEDKYAEDLLKMIPKQSVLKVERDIVELHILAPPKFWEVPGIIYRVVKQVSERNINIIDIVTTHTELSLLVHKENAMAAFEAVNAMVETAKLQQ